MKKDSLVKILTIIVVVLLLLTWFIPASQFTGSEMAKVDITRVGLFDLFNYPLLTFQYFSQMLLFILVVGGFYGILNKTGKYNELVEKFAKKLKGKETAFLVITALVLSIFSSVFGFSIVMFIFIPFLISVILLLGYDKVVALLTTIISILIGIIGSTYNLYVTGYINEILSTNYTDLLVAKISLFVVAFVAYLFFLLKYAKKVKKSSKNSILEEQTEDAFFVKETKNKKKKSWPLLVVLAIIFVLFIIACIPWENAFDVKVFTEFNEIVTTAEIGGYTVWTYILGQINALGSWSYVELTQILLMASIVIALIYRISLDDTIDAFVTGCKKVAKAAIVMCLAMTVVIITAYHPIFPTITESIIGGLSKFNVLSVILVSLLTIIGSVLNIEMVYYVQSIVGYFGIVFTDAGAILSVIIQAMYGLTMIIAPTSLMLILGLEYLKIPYTKWVKFSWKFVLQLFVILLIMLIIISLVA